MVKRQDTKTPKNNEDKDGLLETDESMEMEAELD